MKIAHHSLILTEDNKLLVCGGFDANLKSCLELQKGQWIQHSKLSELTYMTPPPVILSGKVYLFAGRSIFWLATGSKTWQSGPKLQPTFEFKDACAVKLSSTMALLIGGYWTQKKICKFDISTNNLTCIGELQVGRFGHSCAVLGNNIVVAGGRKHSFHIEYFSSTEIISLDNLHNPRLAGQLNIKRGFHKLIVTTINNEQTLLAIGGISNKGTEAEAENSDSIEIWDPLTETWTLSETLKLSEAKHSFGALSVPTSLICP